MRPEFWSAIGVALSVLGGIAVAKLNSRAQARTAEAEKEVSAGHLALQVARESKAESAAAKLEAANARHEGNLAHQEAAAAQKALHEMRLWYITKHKSWDEAVLEVLEQLNPEAAARLPPRTEPPLWPES